MRLLPIFLTSSCRSVSLGPSSSPSLLPINSGGITAISSACSPPCGRVFRFPRLESESEARRTLIELALQDNRPFPVGASAVAPASHSSMGGGGGDTTADMGQAFASANTAGVASSGAVEGLPSHSASAAGGPRSQGPGPGGGGGVAGTAARFGPGTDAYDASGGLRRGVGPEKGARLWAGVGIGAMLQVRGKTFFRRGRE